MLHNLDVSRIVVFSFSWPVENKVFVRMLFCILFHTSWTNTVTVTVTGDDCTNANSSFADSAAQACMCVLVFNKIYKFRCSVVQDNTLVRSCFSILMIVSIDIDIGWTCMRALFIEPGLVVVRVLIIRCAIWSKYLYLRRAVVASQTFSGHHNAHCQYVCRVWRTCSASGRFEIIVNMCNKSNFCAHLTKLPPLWRHVNFNL